MRRRCRCRRDRPGIGGTQASPARTKMTAGRDRAGARSPRNWKNRSRTSLDSVLPATIGSMGARRIGRAVNVARANLTALRANGRLRRTIWHFWRAILQMRARLRHKCA